MNVDLNTFGKARLRAFCIKNKLDYNIALEDIRAGFEESSLIAFEEQLQAGSFELAFKADTSSRVYFLYFEKSDLCRIKPKVIDTKHINHWFQVNKDFLKKWKL